MARNQWHVLRGGETVTLSRCVPPKWDVAAEVVLPGDGRRLRVAHQVRQDVWRRLKGQRGFAPAVAVTRREDGRLHVRAGGELRGPCARAVLVARIVSVLELPANHARWLRFAQRYVMTHSTLDSAREQAL